MVKQYVADEKSTRTRFHYAMLHAREKAIKEKKKHDLAFEAKIQRSRKSRTPLNKKGEDEKMPKRQSIDHSESDTSSCTIERVKRWFSLDEKHLTQREYLLQKRRKKAEKLIAWKARLDEQEKSVIRIEQKASKALKEKKLREEVRVFVCVICVLRFFISQMGLWRAILALKSTPFRKVQLLKRPSMLLHLGKRWS